MLKLHCILCVFGPLFEPWWGQVQHLGPSWLFECCVLYKPNFVLLERKVCHVYMQFKPNLAKPKVQQAHQTQAHSSPIPSRSTHLPRGLGLPRSNFQNFNSNIHNGPRRNKQLDFASFHKQSSHKPYLGYQDHCFILKFVVYYMFLMRIFVEVYCIFVVAMFHAFCL